MLSRATLKANLSRKVLLDLAVKAGEGVFASSGAFCARTGVHTGRSPQDRFIVRDAKTTSLVNWGAANQALSPEHFARLKARVARHMAGRAFYRQDLFVGANDDHRVGLRVVCEQAWHAAFARTLLQRPTRQELETFQADWTLIQCPSLDSVPQEDGTRTGTFVVLNFSERLILIGGTAYAGEIKKSAFSLLNFILPGDGVLPMHCSANVGPAGDTALFFGLSGTGKTTLSADSDRRLIGDDEHGWGETGIFNFEGGCYAKAINLSAEQEPEIYAATSRPGAILENVVLDATGTPDYGDTSLTENTRCAYPLRHMGQRVESGMGSHPRHILFLTLDAFGVLPPLAALSPDQAVEHFLIGYTSKVAGTEKGLGKEPEATFSTCYGAPFMPRAPQAYADLLRSKLTQHGTQVWLVNTGWIGGGYGIGRRISLTHTRALIRAVLANALNRQEFETESVFGLSIPRACPDVPASILHPKKNWSNSTAYDQAATALRDQFETRLQGYGLRTRPTHPALESAA